MNKPSSQPPAPSEICDSVTTEQLRAVAKQARKKADIHRLCGWLSVVIPAVLFFGAVAGMATSDNHDQVAQSVFFVAFPFLFILAPVAALMLFSSANKYSAKARQATVAPAPRQGNVLKSAADPGSTVADEHFQAPRKGQDLKRAADQWRMQADSFFQRWSSKAIMGLHTLGAICIALFSVSFDRRDQDMSGFSVTVLTLGVVSMVLGVLLLLLGSRQDSLRRQAAMAEFASNQGFGYKHRLLEAEGARFIALPLFRHGRRHGGQITHFMHGDVLQHALSVMVFGYDHNIQNGPKDRCRQTVMISTVSRSCPAFRLWPGINDHSVARILNVLNMDGNPATAGLESNQVAVPLSNFAGAIVHSYRLFTRPEDEEVVQRLLNDRVVQLLLADRTLVVESADGLLAVYRPNTVWKPAEYPKRMAEALAVCDALSMECENQS